MGKASKHSLGKIYRKKRKSPPREINQEQLTKNLAEVIRELPNGYWGAYRAFNGEIGIEENRELFSKAKIELCFPRVEKEDLNFFRIRDWERDFELHDWGILEPLMECEYLDKDKLQLCIIPVLAFDHFGTRLGHGKGFYDRFLADFEGLKIGLAHDWQLYEGEIPRNSHDIPMDIVVTDSQIHRFSNKT